MKMLRTLPAPDCAHSNIHRGVKSSLHLKPFHPVGDWSCSVTSSQQHEDQCNPVPRPGERLGWCRHCFSLGTAELL